MRPGGGEGGASEVGGGGQSESLHNGVGAGAQGGVSGVLGVVLDEPHHGQALPPVPDPHRFRAPGRIQWKEVLLLHRGIPRHPLGLLRLHQSLHRLPDARHRRRLHQRHRLLPHRRDHHLNHHWTAGGVHPDAHAAHRGCDPGSCVRVLCGASFVQFDLCGLEQPDHPVGDDGGLLHHHGDPLLPLLRPDRHLLHGLPGRLLHHQGRLLHRWVLPQ
mmetsp:Transcript_27356/g.26414  ORF Transcript_27356/g.26414 Transcript_27356/m.26414 type:complete len:216 (+) Transcript_27356:475-1122(+)